MDPVLVLGSGGREHCLAWKLLQSPQVSKVFVSPGNGGTAQLHHCVNVELNLSDFDAVSDWCKDEGISLVVVGPEDPLAHGIVDHLSKQGVACFGPSRAAAQLEASKEFAKQFMDRHGIPTARWSSFTDVPAAKAYIQGASFEALVVKASGLAAGKGVSVCDDRQGASQRVEEMLAGQAVGDAGRTVVIEERLQGHEVSCLAFTDGSDILCLPPAQDHKRLRDGNQGPNTGGMGAYAPCPLVSQADLAWINENIVSKVIQGMKQEGCPYVGLLYTGLMLTSEGPKVLEFNCRFGDPETQVLLPLVKCNIYDVMKACIMGSLNTQNLMIYEDKFAVATVLVSEGYPGKYEKGKLITGTEKVKGQMKDSHLFHAGTKLKDNSLVTNGGRVLATVSVDTSLAIAVQRSQLSASMITFEGRRFRCDIALESLTNNLSLSYADCGVNIGAGDALVTSIKPFAKATARPGCAAVLGGFGGVFDLKQTGYIDPLLISGADGVGTKLKVAEQCCDHRGIGQDLVAMCVNDILCHGAEPLFFLDYLATGKLDVEVARAVVKSVAAACEEAGCALLGGETAEMPGVYLPGTYDLAGFAVGAVERKAYLPRLESVEDGDSIIGLASTGIHSNGFSLVRRLVENCHFTYDMCCPWETSGKLGDALLTPTALYIRPVLPLMRQSLVKAAAHITGGGLVENLPRVLPTHLTAQLDALAWHLPPVFTWIANKGNVAAGEMARTFNLGVGMTLVVSDQHQQRVLESLQQSGIKAWRIGTVTQKTQGTQRVFLENLDVALKHGHLKQAAENKWPCEGDKRPKLGSSVEAGKKRVGVLISGTGTNLQALLDHTQDAATQSRAEVVLVVSNKIDAPGLRRAQAAGVATLVVSHHDYQSREEFDAAVSELLVAAGVEIVCLAGFMRILSASFVRQWSGRLLNVHPSLLPSFKGANAHAQVLQAGVRVSGCSVHFVEVEVDAGAILVQETVPVLPGDTVESLQERVKTKEHLAFPRALELLASGQALLGCDGKVVWA